ncbi:FAD-dependent monooxygenase [Paralcaligenes ginsengisoli]
MDSPEYDIAITGDGPVGCTLALLLAGKAPIPQRIALIGKHFLAPGLTAVTEATDPRTLAINHGSRVLLEHLQAWPDQAASIETVHVSQRGRLGRTLVRHTELNVPRLGSVVSYDRLLATLHAAVARCGIDVISASTVTTQCAGTVRIDLADRSLSSALLVQSDGARPKGVQRDYRQHAVLATVRASRPAQNWAYERFTAEGPLAVLPHPQAANLYGIVWCCSPLRAEDLRGLDDQTFATALHEQFGDRLGHFTCIGPRHVFPLALHAGPSLLNGRTVAIGNAAQTLHPVAGQGLNLGLRDAVQLAQSLAPWLQRSQDDPGPLLARFAQNRRPDRWLTAGITDFLPRIFATKNPLIEHACGLSLLALDLSATLRAPLARHLLRGLRS